MENIEKIYLEEQTQLHIYRYWQTQKEMNASHKTEELFLLLSIFQKGLTKEQLAYLMYRYDHEKNTLANIAKLNAVSKLIQRTREKIKDQNLTIKYAQKVFFIHPLKKISPKK